MTLSLRLLLMLATIWFAAGCSKSKSPADADAGKRALSGDSSTATASARRSAPKKSGYQTVEDVPEGLRVQAEKFGKRFERDILSGNAQNVRQAFDRAAIADGVCEGLRGGPPLDRFKEGLQRGLQNGVAQLVKTWADQVPKFKHVVVYNGQVAARFRFLSERQGITLIDFVLRTNQAGELVIRNLCNHAMGYDMIEQSRRAAAPMLAELDKTFLERVFNRPDISMADMQKFGDLARKANSGDFAGVIALYKTLPEGMRHTMAATGIYIMAWQNSGNTDGYKQALKEAAVRFKDGSFQLMLVDVYALDKQFAKAASCVDQFMNYLEKDAALLTLQSLMLNAAGDVQTARSTLQEALELEPDCTYVHSKGLDVLLAAKDFKAVRDSMVFLEKNAGYSFKGNLNGPLWQGFRAAAESVAWR